MLKKDYLVDRIEEMVKAVLKMVFKKNTQEMTVEILENEGDRDTLNALLELAKEGKINEAENLLYEKLDIHNKEHLKMGLVFYHYLNEQEDDFLEAHQFSREEVKVGIEDLAGQYNVGGILQLFSQEENL